MSEFLPSRLLPMLERLLGDVSSQRLCIALSGGLDSMVLLHALAMLRSEAGWQLRAVHVNHQLQQPSNGWAQQCVEWCAQLSVPCKILTVHVGDTKQQGVEATARKVRYAALHAELQTDEVLLTAHHADDQLETVLIALMRGAGLDGLAAMPSLTRFYPGWHARPLLEFRRDELQAWATKQGLSYISDPTNEHTHFDRNFLRHEVIPLLKQRWSAAATTATRSASHLGETQSMLKEYVGRDLSDATMDSELSVEVLRKLPLPRRRVVIRRWLQHHEVLMPSTQVLHSLEYDMLNSADDRVPCSRWGDYAVHRFHHRLYLEKHYQPEQPSESLLWDWRTPLILTRGLGHLSLIPQLEQQGVSVRGLRRDSLPPELTVSFRQGGERIQLPQESFHRELKKLMNDAGVLPWWRGRIPLIYAGDQLVAVADIWLSAEFAATDAQPALLLQWAHHKTGVFSAS